MAKNFSTAETAALVRKSLKEAFAGVKFSVRSHVYAGGSSINVSWTDGPTDGMVSAITSSFTGAYFDGMTDYKGHTTSMIDGQVVRFAADFIFTRREITPALRAKIDAAFERKYGQRYDADAYDQSHDFWYRELANKFNAYLAPRSSPTANRVIYLGNDGYSQVGALQAAE